VAPAFLVALDLSERLVNDREALVDMTGGTQGFCQVP
jgi:hypothetical protein